VEEKLNLGVREGKRLNITGLTHTHTHIYTAWDRETDDCKKAASWETREEDQRSACAETEVTSRNKRHVIYFKMIYS
jgi:hypothetical protein